jgi:hypothetical protein
VTDVTAVHVVLPGLEGRWTSGGLMIARRAAELLDRHVPTDVVLSHDTVPGVPTLDDAMATAGDGDVFVVTWGPHVRELVDRLAGRRVVYYAQSGGWGLRLPDTVPVLALSRALMAYWMERAPYQPINLLPPVLDERCVDAGIERDIDVLFVARKSTPYLRDHLVPALADQCRLHVQEAFIDRGALIELYQRSKVYLYSSAPAWLSTAPDVGSWVEGFGFQPLEALVSGCTVFSNLHGGLSDYLEPDINAFKLEVHSLAYDRDRILSAVAAFPMAGGDLDAIRGFYSVDAFHDRVERILPALGGFFDAVGTSPPDIAALTAVPPPSTTTRVIAPARRALSSVRRRVRPSGR